tara:strand:+ start:1143 stop:1487 length:345 start_codon:yes stop_codon:yes gene_type:complete
MNKNILFCLLLFLFTQTLVWLQLNGQFVWTSFRKYEWLLIILGMPISWLFLQSTRFGVAGFNGLLWPQRFLAFSCGILVFTVLTWFLKGEGLSVKTLVSLGLSFIILSIQIFWK